MYKKPTEDKPHIPAWLIMAQHYRNSYVFAGLPPRKPLPRRWYAAGTGFRAATPADLAGQVGISADGLAETAHRVSRFARAGHAADLGRRGSAYAQHYGAPRPRPNPH